MTLFAAAALTVAPAAAESARDVLTQASFSARSKPAALQSIGEAERLAASVLARAPADREALLMQATARSYRAKMNGSRADAIAARKMFEALAAKAPLDPEPQLGLGAWHMGAVFKLGGMIGRAALGAQKSVGLAALDRAVAGGGNRAIYAGVAALLRLEQDAGDPKGRALAEFASRAGAPTAFDRVMRRAAAAILASIQSGNAGATRTLAARLLPFGQIDD
ncbi:hypothetical protein NF700_04310 [Sphingomonadaceae bacterium OTU29MARTA1]|nr:hypothetical protein NF700_04310 [Sphingomonadaceae bacterium OTU29MARTA1]USU12957.1 hypothetical protein NF701_03610 [Sphingomonadaceae bacterium OTU29THOMA1]